MAQFKDKKKPQIVKAKKLSSINELCLGVFIIDREEETHLREFVKNMGARVVSSFRGKGVSRNSVFQSIRVGTKDVTVVLVACPSEDIENLMKKVTLEFELDIPGNGKGIAIDIDGYLGAKALFMED